MRINPASAAAKATTTDEGWSQQAVAPYVGVLVLAVLLALAMLARIFDHYGHIAHQPDLLLDGAGTLLKIGFGVQFLLFWWLALRRMLPALMGKLPLPQIGRAHV